MPSKAVRTSEIRQWKRRADKSRRKNVEASWSAEPISAGSTTNSGSALAPRSRAFGFDASTGPIPRLDRAYGIMSAPDNPLAPVRQFEIAMPGEERR